MSFKKQREQAERLKNEFGAFNAHTKGVGLKLMLKMGYQMGKGLGSNKEGIVEPIAVQVLPKEKGLGFGKQKETAESEKEDEVAPLEVPSWKKTAKRQPRKKPKSMPELLQIVDEAAPQKIFDATGKEISGVSQFDQVSHLPELRYNLRLIEESCSSQLISKLRQIKHEQKTRETIENDLEQFPVIQAQLVEQIETTRVLLNAANALKISPETGKEAVFDTVTTSCDQFISLEDKYWAFNLDMAVVASIAPIVKRSFADWNPLLKPKLLLPELKSIRRWLVRKQKDGSVSDSMSPYESLLFTTWFPKVRSFLSTQWTVDSDAALTLLEAWFPHSSFDGTKFPPGAMIPCWMYHILVAQVVLPKIVAAIDNWKPGKSRIESWLFPWLPILKSKIKDKFVTIRHALVSHLQDWDPSDVSVKALIAPWKLVMDKKTFDGLLARAILPKLLLGLRELEVDPTNQDLVPLTQTFEWFDLFSHETFGHLLQTEFFPKWLETLDIWLSAESVQLEEVMQWFTWWKSVFEGYQTLHVKEAFKAALDRMNSSVSSNFYDKTSIRKTAPLVTQKSFKEVFEQEAAKRGLFLLPLNQIKIVGVTRFVVYNLTRDMQKRGVYVYLDDGVIFENKSSDEWRPVGMFDLLDRL